MIFFSNYRSNLNQSQSFTFCCKPFLDTQEVSVYSYFRFFLTVFFIIFWTINSFDCTSSSNRTRISNIDFAKTGVHISCSITHSGDRISLKINIYKIIVNLSWNRGFSNVKIPSVVNNSNLFFKMGSCYLKREKNVQQYCRSQIRDN